MNNLQKVMAFDVLKEAAVVSIVALVCPTQQMLKKLRRNVKMVSLK